MAIINHPENVVRARGYTAGVPAIAAIFTLSQGEPGMIAIVVDVVLIVAKRDVGIIVWVRSVPHDRYALALRNCHIT